MTPSIKASLFALLAITTLVASVAATKPVLLGVIMTDRTGDTFCGDNGSSNYQYFTVDEDGQPCEGF